MHTVLGSLASTLGVLALVGVVISLLIWLVGFWRGSAAAESIKDAKTLLPKDPDGEASFTSDKLERFAPKPSWWSKRRWLLPAVSGILGAAVSIVIGMQLVYAPMVSESYRQLYHAYCRADAVADVVSRRVAGRNISAVKEMNACLPPRAVDTGAATPVVLTQDDVFFLLDTLGLKDTREKTKAEMFAGGENSTKNHQLAVWLADPKVYTVGTPTSLLLLRLAGKIGSAYAVEVKCPTSGEATEATQIGLQTAILSAVLAQQPRPDNRDAALGTALLGVNGLLPLNKIVQFDETSCDGNKALIEANLGPNLGGSGPSWRTPLLEKPGKRLTDGQIISLILGWAGAKAKDLASQDAAIAFMEAITSESSGSLEVRDARIAVNFFIGWERLAILCIVPFLGLCLLWQQLANSDDTRHLRYIKQTIVDTPHKKKLRALSLAILAKRLYRSVGRSGPREILVAALEVHDQVLSKSPSVDFDRVNRVAEHETRIVDRSRFFFLAGLPLLPTIGFVGTVRSLIEALALADRIPRARTAIEQVAAVSDVTSTLSLCFSTTFMALGALLIFAPLDLWQATSERRVLEETERLLDPGL